MLSATQKAADVPTSPGPGAYRKRVSSHQTDDTASLSQWDISKLPDEVLSHIFNHLGCDDIAQVSDTRRQFRRVVHARHWEALEFSQLPARLRNQHQQSLPLRKQMVQKGLHPFITRPSAREYDVFDAEQQAAVSSFHLCKRMTSTSRYRPTEVLAESISAGTELYTPGSGTILLFYKYHFLFLLSQNNSGSWSSQSLDLIIQDGIRPLAAVSISSNKRYLSVFSHNTMIEIYQFDGGSWQFYKLQLITEGGQFVVSPSRKYLSVLTKTSRINSIRRFDETAHWSCMPMPCDSRNALPVEWQKFSPSEQHIAIKYKEELVILSVNSQGSWNVSWETTWNRDTDDVRLQFSPSEKHIAISYKKKVVILSLGSGGSWNELWESPSNRSIHSIEFCPSGRWLMIGFFCSVDMIRLDPAGKCMSQQRISSRKLDLTFSPAGKYLVSDDWGKNYLLWRLLESGQWVFYGDLNDSSTPGFGLTHMLDMVFSSCDNYLFTSAWDRGVNIWGRDGHGSWMALSSGQCDEFVRKASFSKSGANALTLGWRSIRIWGRDDGELWAVKAVISATHVWDAHFHPMAEHLIIIRRSDDIRIWEIRADDSSGDTDKGGTIV